jgi:hypothetical protein
MRPSAEEPATKSNGWECLALLREKAATEEGDAFLGRLRRWDVVLLMGEGPYRVCVFGMHRPYGQGGLGMVCVRCAASLRQALLRVVCPRKRALSKRPCVTCALGMRSLSECHARG